MPPRDTKSPLIRLSTCPYKFIIKVRFTNYAKDFEKKGYAAKTTTAIKKKSTVTLIATKLTTRSEATARTIIIEKIKNNNNNNNKNNNNVLEMITVKNIRFFMLLQNFLSYF